MLTQAILKENLYYSVITGQFFRLKSPCNKVKIGDVAGGINSHGYLQIRLFNKLYKTHRLAWLYITGEWPQYEIDHKNTIRSDNQWINLRDVTGSQNCCNTGMKSTNKSGYKGVHWDNYNKKWRVRIMLKNKYKHIGYFDDIELAYAERLKAEKELHGEFSRG